MTTTPLFLLPDGRLAEAASGARLDLDGDEGRHAGLVRRIKPGEEVDLADGSGRRAHCIVAEASRQGLTLIVTDIRETPVPTPRLVLVQALAKSGRDEQAVEAATEVGVDAVVPWQAARSVVVWSGERGERSRGRWEQIARSAAKQSRRVRVPAVEVPVTTADLSARVPQAAVVLVLHESAKESLHDVDVEELAGVEGDVLVVVGPEGGVSDDELEELLTAGARAVRLGPEVLRASTAGPVALAVLAYRLGRWA